MAQKPLAIVALLTIELLVTTARGQSPPTPGVLARSILRIGPEGQPVQQEAAAASGRQHTSLSQSYGQATSTTNFGTASMLATLNFVHPLPRPTQGYAQDPGVGSHAVWRDRVTIQPNDPSLVGTRGKFTPLYDVPYQAFVAVGGTGPAQVSGGVDISTRVYVGEPPVHFSAGSQSYVTHVGVNQFGQQFPFSYGKPPGLWRTEAPVHFVFGEPFILETTVNAAIGGSLFLGGTSGSGYVDLTGGMTWGGFDGGVFDSSNNPVQFSLNSAAGIDWSKPSLVPWNTGGGGSDYTSDANWIFGRAPTSSQSVLLGRNGSYTIDNIDTANQSLIARAGDVTVNATQYDLTRATLNEPSLLVGEAAGSSPRLTLASGETRSVSTVVGMSAGSDGELRVVGAGTMLNNSQQLYVGHSGEGDLLVAGQGTLEASDLFVAREAASVGSVRVEGADSKLIYVNSLVVGDRGSASFTVTDGALLTEATNIGAPSPSPAASPELGVVIAGQQPESNADIRFDHFSSGKLSQVQIGRGGNAEIVVSDGSKVETDIGTTLGLLASAEGKLTVRDANSEWNAGGFLTIGTAGKGTVEVAPGARVKSGHATMGFDATGKGLLVVHGAGSKLEIEGTGNIFNPNPSARLQVQIDRGAGSDGLLLVGNAGEGNVVVSDGGYLAASNIMSGADAGFGRIVVENSGSKLLTGGLWIGNRGSAELHVRDGAEVVAGHLLVGGGQSQRPTAPIVTSAIVSGTGSRAQVDGTVGIGDFGQASVIVESGGFVSSRRLEIGGAGTGHLLIDGAGSAWDATNVLSMHRGQLDVIAGGRLETLGGTVGDYQGDQAIVVISGQGSTWNLKSQPLYLGLDRRDRVRFSGGRVNVRVENGGQLLGSDILVRYNGILSGDGLIVGNIRNAGAIRPGRSPGTLTIDGNYEQEDVGILEMEIGGLAGGADYDQLIVTGNAAMDGELLVKFVDGFAPQQGQQFSFLDVTGAVSGDFASSRYQGLMPGFQYDVIQDGTHFMLTALNDSVPCQGGLADIDVDGNIDRNDVARLIQRFALDTEPLAAPGDFNCDGAVTLADVSLLQQQLSPTAAPTSAAVPEPATIILLQLLA